MNRLDVVTPSYLGDFDLFRELHTSVVNYLPVGTMHKVIVPERDQPLFRSIDSPQLSVVSVESYLPPDWRSLMSVSRRLPSKRMQRVQYFNPRAPWMPVRGWIVQQIVKLAAAADSQAECVLIADSDVSFVRAVRTSDVLLGDAVRLYADPAGLTPQMKEQRRWQEIARRMLGRGTARAQTDDADYVSGLVSWNPKVVRMLVSDISGTTDTFWQDRLARLSTFSECYLYGEYVQGSKATELVFASSESLCASHWDAAPMSAQAVDELVTRVGPSTLAVQIQSTAEMTVRARRTIIKEIEGVAAHV